MEVRQLQHLHEHRAQLMPVGLLSESAWSCLGTYVFGLTLVFRVGAEPLIQGAGTPLVYPRPPINHVLQHG